MCVFLESMCLKLLLRVDFERLIWCLDHWLSCILDCIHVCVFLFSKNCFYKVNLTPPRHLAICRALKFFLITISTPSWYLVDRSRFSSCVFAFSSTPPRQLHLSTLFFSTPSSTDGLTPLDTSICRELLRIYIYAHRNPVLISSSSLDRSAPVHLPNTLSFTSNLFLKHSLRLIRFFFTW